MTSSHMLICPTDLVEWRKRNGVSLSAISAATKISQRYLEAIEGGKFNRLPGGVYNLSYLRQYAQAINYEEDDLLEYYRSMVAPETPAPPVPEAPQKWFNRVWHRLCFL